MHRILLIALPLVVASLVGGCWFFDDWDDDCGCWYGECDPWGGLGDDDGSWSSAGGWPPSTPGTTCVPGSARYCDTPTYCSWGEQRCNPTGDGWGPCLETSPPPGCSGFMYDQDCCIAAGACCQDWLDYDRDGDWNDSIGACEEVPRCGSDDDCAAFGPGLACAPPGVCVPTTSPCPDGRCGCTDDSECGAGLLCIASLCTEPEAVCFFDLECGEGARCLNNECHMSCASDAGCPAGQACSGGLCLEPPGGLDGCVYDEDCGSGRRCVNATCVAACNSDAGCGARETCRSGACAADPSPVRECASASECPTDMGCLRGVCRLPCAADLNCSGALSICGAEGFCEHPAEVDPGCERATDCAAGQVCLGNRCTTLPD